MKYVVKTWLTLVWALLAGAFVTALFSESATYALVVSAIVLFTVGGIVAVWRIG